jgi:thioredoxin-related protein
MSLISTLHRTSLAVLLSVAFHASAQTLPGSYSEEDMSGETVHLEKLPFVEDLQAETRSAACGGHPLVLMFGSAHCPYCSVVRSYYLEPLVVDSRYPGIVVRELEIDSSADVRDFNGDMTTMEQLADQYQVTLVPTVMVFLPGGKQVGETLLGFTTEDFYGAYLDQAIADGMKTIREMTSGAPSGGPGAYACD